MQRVAISSKEQHDVLGGVALAVESIGGDHDVGYVADIEKCCHHHDFVAQGANRELREPVPVDWHNLASTCTRFLPQSRAPRSVSPSKAITRCPLLSLERNHEAVVMRGGVIAGHNDCWGLL